MHAHDIQANWLRCTGNWRYETLMIMACAAASWILGQLLMFLHIDAVYKSATIIHDIVTECVSKSIIVYA